MLEPLLCGLSFPRHPFSRSYGVILPSSLTMLLPSALGFSPHPPVSVYGTGSCDAIVAFLDSDFTCFATIFRSPFRDRSFLSRLRLHLCVPTCSDHMKCRNLHLLSIDYAVRPRLRSRLTRGRSALPRNPWIFGHKDSHLILATHSGILSSRPSTAPFGTVSTDRQCSPTDHT